MHKWSAVKSPLGAQTVLGDRHDLIYEILLQVPSAACGTRPRELSNGWRRKQISLLPKSARTTFEPMHVFEPRANHFAAHHDIIKFFASHVSVTKKSKHTIFLLPETSNTVAIAIGCERCSPAACSWNLNRHRESCFVHDLVIRGPNREIKIWKRPREIDRS